MTPISEHFDDSVTVIALHFNDTIFDGTPTATGSPELFTKGDDGRGVKCQTSYHRDALAGATLGFHGHA